ncbi:cutinase family protein [Mycolicibacterium nivoides]
MRVEQLIFGSLCDIHRQPTPVEANVMFHRRPPHLRQPNTYESLMSRGIHLYVSEPEELQSRSISFVDSLRSRIGGRSLGAAIDMASADLPPEISGHVAAVADFGGPRTLFAEVLSPGPLPAIGPLYAGKMIDMCVPNDPICFEGGWICAHTPPTSRPGGSRMRRPMPRAGCSRSA